MKFEIRRLTETDYELKITENSGFSWRVYECKDTFQLIALIVMTFDDVTITIKDGVLSITKKKQITT